MVIDPYFNRDREDDDDYLYEKAKRENEIYEANKRMSPLPTCNVPRFFDGTMSYSDWKAKQYECLKERDKRREEELHKRDNERIMGKINKRRSLIKPKDMRQDDYYDDYEDRDEDFDENGVRKNLKDFLSR